MDITKCKGNKCPIKYKCYRYTAKTSEYQSYFAETPFEINDGVFSCVMFWGKQAEGISNQLKDIVNGKL